MAGRNVVHGAGSQSKVIRDALRARGVPEPDLTDDATRTKPQHGDNYIIAIGDNRIRSRRGGNWTVIHPSAVLSSTCRIGAGCYIGAFAFVGPDAVVGRGCIVNTGAIVEHDCKLGEFVHMAPRSVLCGHVTIGDGTLMGAASVVRQELVIGSWAVVGCGSVVVCNVPDDETWVGNPAHPLKS